MQPELPLPTEEWVARRLEHIAEDIAAVDPDRARFALERLFDKITVAPLDGDWANGWSLEMKYRPLKLVAPEGGESCADSWLRGQDLNLRPSGYEQPDGGLHGAPTRSNPAETLVSYFDTQPPNIQAVPSQHSNFGQPVVSGHERSPHEGGHHDLLTPAQAAARFHVPEYLLRKACSEGRLEHLRVVNALWLVPAAVAVFAESWRAGRGIHDT